MPTTSINGCEYYYDIQGNGPETIVFAHGLLMSNYAFHKQVEYFKSKYRTVVFDQRGHGKTQFTENGYELDNLTDDVTKLIEFLNFGPVHYVGHSMGGFIGLRLAARRPDLVRSLILINTSAEAKKSILRYKVLKFLTLVFGVKTVAKTVNKLNFGKKFLTDPKMKQERLYWLNHISNLPKAILSAADPVVYRQSVESELDKIVCPTLIIGGRKDIVLSPRNSEFMDKNIANSTLQILEEVGHCAAIEEPDRVNQMIEQFLQSQQSRP